MSFLSYIIWSPNPDIFNIGFLTIRWYGLLFALGFIIGQQIIFYIFKKEGKPEKDVETITIYMVIATILGARLGHVLFYQPAEYFSDPLKILKIWEGGLASHGAAAGILAAIYLYSNYYINISFKELTVKKIKRKGQSYLWVFDKIVIVVALAGALIRFGNFMNSEIVGIPTDSNYGVIFGWDAEREFEISDALENDVIEDVEFAKASLDTLKPEGLQPITMTMQFVDGNFEESRLREFIDHKVRNVIVNYDTMHFRLPEDQVNFTLSKEKGHYIAKINLLGVPRHPTQLYESISSLLIFLLLFFYWRNKYETIPNGRIFGLFLVILFSLRFFYEFIKENQVAFEEDMPLNMGQWLSIPLVIAGIFILIKTGNASKETSGDAAVK